MYQRYKERFGTAGVVIGVIALVLALVTGAYAAGGGLSGKQKKEVEKIAKKYAGKPGAPGTNGTNGKDGANGEKGPKGDPGTKGVDGTDGVDGKSPEIIEEFTAGEPGCGENGGYVYEVEGSSQKAEICNGKEGQDGIEGKPWTAGGTLPPGATETGEWAFAAPKGQIKVDVEGTTEEITIAPPGGYFVPVSFPIKFPFKLKAAHVHFGPQESGGAFVPGGACPGKFFTPEAAPGELCVYQNAVVGAQFVALHMTPTGNPGATKAGTFIQFEPNTTEAFEARGSYAVTGCEEEPGTEECKP